MLRCVVVILLAICLLQIGNLATAEKKAADKTVECYDCVNCLQTNEETAKKSCPYHFDPAKAKTCVTYAEAYPYRESNKNGAWVIRGCATERGSCEDIKLAYANDTDLVELSYCKECQGNYCNSVSRSLPNLIFGFFAVVIVPILAKLTLS